MSRVDIMSGFGNESAMRADDISGVLSEKRLAISILCQINLNS